MMRILGYSGYAGVWWQRNAEGAEDAERSAEWRLGRGDWGVEIGAWKLGIGDRRLVIEDWIYRGGAKVAEGRGGRMGRINE
jgi:hypothetical protein